MDIQEALQRRLELEREIRDRLIAFVDETGLTVEAVNLGTITSMQINELRPKQIISGVHIEVRI